MASGYNMAQVTSIDDGLGFTAVVVYVVDFPLAVVGTVCKWLTWPIAGVQVGDFMQVELDFTEPDEWEILSYIVGVPAGFFAVRRFVASYKNPSNNGSKLEFLCDSTLRVNNFMLPNDAGGSTPNQAIQSIVVSKDYDSLVITTRIPEGNGKEALSFVTTVIRFRDVFRYAESFGISSTYKDNMNVIIQTMSLINGQVYEGGATPAFLLKEGEVLP